VQCTFNSKQVYSLPLSVLLSAPSLWGHSSQRCTIDNTHMYTRLAIVKQTAEILSSNVTLVFHLLMSKKIKKKSLMIKN